MSLKQIFNVTLLSLFSLSAFAQVAPESLAVQAVKRVPGFEQAEISVINTQYMNDRIAVRVQQSFMGIAIEGAEAVVALNPRDGSELYIENKLVSKFAYQSVSSHNMNLHRSLDLGENKSVNVAVVLSQLRASFAFTAGLAQNIVESRVKVADISREADQMVLREELRLAVLNQSEEIEFLKSKLVFFRTKKGTLGKKFIGDFLRIGTKNWPVRVVASADDQNFGQIISVMKLTHSLSEVVIHDGAFNPTVPITTKGVKLMVNGRPVNLLKKALITSQAREASENLILTRDFYYGRFARNSYDGLGAQITAIVRVGAISFLDLFGLRQNAAWAGSMKLFLFGKGDGDGLQNLTSATDAIAHEYTHAVIDTSSGLAYQGQSGALNEHLADVFGEMIQTQSGRVAKGKEFLIGEGTISGELARLVRERQNREVRALRDMANPNLGLMPQPGTMSQIAEEYGPNCVPSSKNDNCGVHINSGVLNKMSVLVVQKLGWAKSQGLFYNTMVGRLTSQAQFNDYVQALKNECNMKLNPADCLAINESAAAVGL